MTKIRSSSLDKLADCYVCVLKVRGCENGMSCASEIKSNGWFNQRYLASCPSTRNNIISQLLQCLWLPHLKGSNPLNHMTLARAHVLARSRDKLKTLHLQCQSASLPNLLGWSHTILQVHVINKNHDISTIRFFWSSKLVE